ncbi:MAG: hypothetical protein ABI947_20820 [Chloroflexota bacterium]
MSRLFLPVATRRLAPHKTGFSLPNDSMSVVYQSGQTVPVTGQYELAGAEPKSMGASGEKIVRELSADNLFPDYEGRAVAWHPLRTPASSTN